MVKFFIPLVLMQLSFAFSQELPGLDPNKKTTPIHASYFRPGLIKASATISPGRMIQNDANTINLSGFLEYILDENYSVRGDVIQFLDANFGSNSVITPNFQNRLYVGAFRHFGKSNLKFFTGLQMGTTVTTYNHSWFAGNRTHVAPSFSIKTGVNYYVWKYFHFFADITYANSTLRGTSFGSQHMDELFFSAGLGFQIQTRKHVKKYRTTGTPSF
ncbi:MAG: hypothetical protein K9G31_07555 [Crocinitomicaceae bacterium]|nr:hypothetical protein [Crocinitomicaceae bacterium]